MFGPVKTKCPVCETEQVTDILYHGPGVAGMWYECGHEAHYDSVDGKARTRYYKDKELIKEFTK